MRFKATKNGLLININLFMKACAAGNSLDLKLLWSEIGSLILNPDYFDLSKKGKDLRMKSKIAYGKWFSWHKFKLNISSAHTQNYNYMPWKLKKKEVGNIPKGKA